MPTLPVHDGEIYYEESGTGKPLVLAHGIGGNHAVWYQQVPELSTDYHLITFDHRGFGNSRDRGGLGRSAFVSDLEMLLDHLEIETAALVGQSMGGGTVLGFAHAHPDRCNALVLCDSLHGFVESDKVTGLMDEARVATKDLSQLERVLGDSTRLGQPAKAALYRQLSSFNVSNRHNLRGEFFPLVSPEQLATTDVPVLFLVGEFDALFPAAAVRQMHAEVEGSQYVEIKGSGHSVFFEDPDAFNSQLLSFLSGKV